MRVLVGYDGSEHSQGALATVAGLPLPSESTVDVLVVVELTRLTGAGPALVPDVAAMLAEVHREQIAQGERLAEEARAALAKYGLKGEALTRIGQPGLTLVEFAEERAVDLIVVGAKGVTGLERFLLGSVSADVARHAHCSVLVTRLPTRPIQRVLLATDGSAPSRTAVEAVASGELPLPAEAEYLVVSALPPAHGILGLPDLLSFASIGQSPEETRAARGAAAQRVVDEAVAVLERAGRRARALVDEGRPAEVILDVAESESADLIVVGSRGLGGLQRLLMGSVAAEVLRHAPCSVLVARHRPGR